MTDEERHRLLYALHHAAVDGQKTTLARIHYSWLASAADEIERLAAENTELRKTQLTFRTIERQPFTIKDEP